MAKESAFIASFNHIHPDCGSNGNYLFILRLNQSKINSESRRVLAEGARALPGTLSGGVLLAS